MAEAYTASATSKGTSIAPNVTSSSSSLSPVRDSASPLGLVGSLLHIARSGTSYSKERSDAPNFLPDYVPLPEDDADEDNTYTIDRDPDGSSEKDNLEPTDFLCPDQLEDMLIIVRRLREARLEALHVATITPVQKERTVPKDRANNFTYTNMSDFE